MAHFRPLLCLPSNAFVSAGGRNITGGHVAEVFGGNSNKKQINVFSKLLQYSSYSTDNSPSEYTRKYIPRRAVMYVPASDLRKIAKIPTLGVDSIVLDCEDGVAVNKKEEARTHIRKYLDNYSKNSASRPELTVRVNSVQSGLCQQDLETILPARHLPSAIHVPKVDGVDHLKWFTETATKILGKERNIHQKINLIIFVESAMSLLSLPHICQTAWDLSTKSHFVPDAVVFGSDDYCADIGATRTNEGKELVYARQYIVSVAKAFKLQAIDIVYIDYKDIDGLRKQAIEGAQWGFTGKQIIHPNQVPICQEAFSPSLEKIEWARELIQGFEKHQKSGKGAFTFRGQMIDMPLVLQARNIVQLAEIVEKATAT
ncbi:Citrate lyase subunit beta-like protein, mitochondrial [Orchesella cincta]|uniref:Citramalyl-CoA lyase, mitochondrial n=1 Tax=Orchesella cincta TaxID=48709 RepID=A0A1D2NAL2_ORCCI|nr:Citrate lyase subunit beta-like protein, mitochondrial [Orchesella cincta]